MKAGDYGIANAYAVEVATDWSAAQVGATLPPIKIVTPYGEVDVMPKFEYGTNLLPIDAPVSYKKGSEVQFDYPNAEHVSTATVQDTYGRSGVPFVLNVASHLPAPQQPADIRATGWSSQLGLGGRDGTRTGQIWSPSGSSGIPLRPDFDFGKARSELERLPTATFTAEATLRFKPPNPTELLKGVAKSMASGMELWVWVDVTPSFQADYAAQLALLSREGMLTHGCLPRQGEFGRTCGLAEAAVALQAASNARIRITGKLHLKINFPSPVPDVAPPDRSFNVSPPPADPGWDPPHIADVKQAHQSTKVGWAMHAAERPESSLWQGVKSLSGATSGDVRQWTNACFAAPPKHPTPPPPPSHGPSTDDLTPDLLPCNICVADSRQNQYPPFKLFEVTNRKPGLPESVCLWEKNAGCYDLCSWNGKNWNRVEQSAVTVVGPDCAAKPIPIPR